MATQRFSGRLLSARQLKFSGASSLACDTRGGIAIAFAAMAVPLFLTIGGAIDYSRAVHFRAELQSVADSAALAAANDYDGTQNGATTAAAVGNAYLSAGSARLPENAGLATTVTPTVVGTGYQVAVTATASMSTTFLGVLMPSIPITVSATALNPQPYGTISPGFGGVGGFSASAADTNTTYWYTVPSDGSIPPDSALNILWSNHSGIAPSTIPPIALTPNQAIGFALRNTTGSTYGTNQYGSAPGNTQTFYSHLANPSDSVNGYTTSNDPADPYGVNGDNPATGSSAASGSQGNNCSLQVIVVNADGTAAAPAAHTCFSSAFAFQAPTCKQLAGKQVVFYWNDMGGPTDDKDYNDTVFTYGCNGGGKVSAGFAPGPNSVVLTN